MFFPLVSVDLFIAHNRVFVRSWLFRIQTLSMFGEFVAHGWSQCGGLNASFKPPHRLRPCTKNYQTWKVLYTDQPTSFPTEYSIELKDNSLENKLFSPLKVCKR